jgi:hypothetical protein
MSSEKPEHKEKDHQKEGEHSKPEKAQQVKKKSGQTQLVTHLKKHLLAEVYIPVIAVIVLLVLVLVKVPYQAMESYSEIVQEPVQQVVPDTANPQQVRVCDDVPARVIVSELFKPYLSPFGIHDFFCKAQITVRNQESTEGNWAYKYVFDASGKEIVSDTLNQTIQRLAKIDYEFQVPCQEGDKVTGHYELVSGPTTIDCNYETVIPNKTITVMVDKEFQKERKLVKYEPLWQNLLGYNENEKV